MKDYIWDPKKNEELKNKRHISFEEVMDALRENRVLDITDHPNKKRYPSQKMLIVEINDYAYVVPFVEDKEKYFLKTIFPSRKRTKQYLRGGEKL